MSDQIFVAITLMCVCGYPISAACVIDPGFGEVFEYPNYCFGCLCDGSVMCWWLIDDDDSAVCNWRSCLVHGDIDCAVSSNSS